jgi:hypothetical protein
MKTIKDELLDIDFTEHYINSYARAIYNKELKIGICEALDQYIPVDQFMEVFAQCSDMIKRKELKHFIFDKRNLRSFHQPSMEWYFIEWKHDMLDLGLKDHYKILPNENWFKKCVEAGRAQIEEDYPDNRLDELSITYVESIQEAITTIKETQLSHA